GDALEAGVGEVAPRLQAQVAAVAALQPELVGPEPGGAGTGVDLGGEPVLEADEAAGIGRGRPEPLGVGAPRPKPAQVAGSIWARSWSLTRMLATWLRTVFSETPSRSATSWLPRPRATILRISTSRSDSRGPAPITPSLMVPIWPSNSLSSFDASDGLMRLCPA